MTPTAVCEVDASRLAVATGDFPGIETYASVEEMLAKSKVDLITIITPHNTHAPLALKCLNAGRHVVCEKPLAITTQECDDMIAAAKKNNAVLSTFHNRHWDGCALSAVKQIREGIIGDVVRIQATMGGYGKPGDWWRSSKSISGGILYDWGVHLLEYSLQILEPSAMTEVSGYAHSGFWGPQIKWKEDAIEDEGFAVVRFQGGRWLTLRITNVDSKPVDQIVTVTGTLGTYSFNHATHEITHVRDGKTYTIKAPNVPGENQKYYDNVAAHLVTGEPLVITPEWSRRPIHILDLAVQSAKLGHAIKTTYA
jgi:predicted dehydrogenase